MRIETKMVVISLFILSTVLSVAFALPACEQVNSFIATNGLAYGYGGINPGAQYPFGSFRLGPDTTSYVVDLTYRHFSGYNYQDNTIRAFSHTHLVGAGVNDLGSVGVMPLTLGKKDERNFPLNSWWSVFNKSTESASPGFYSVYLNEPKTKVELMAVSTLAGVHRYSWDSLTATSTPTLVVDICHDSKIHSGEGDNRCLDADLTLDATNANIFTGHVHTKGGLSDGQIVYIYAELHNANSDKNSADVVDSWTMCSKDSSSDKKLPNCQDNLSTLSSAEHLYGLARLNKKSLAATTLSVDLRIAISYISGDVAKQNYQAAFAQSTDFSALAQRTKDTWCNQLSFISATGLDQGDADFLSIFYSAHYRALMVPSDYTEAGGLYKGVDKQIHNVTEERLAKYGVHDGSTFQFRWYSDFSFWDTFRTFHPWILLMNEDLAMAIARSITEITIQQNAFPRWVLGAREASCMLGEHGAAAIVEMIEAGLAKEIDVAAIQKIFLPQSTQGWPVNGRTDIDRYMTQGYVAQDVSGDSAVETLTYAYDDYLLGKLCEYVGDIENAAAAYSRSKNYQVIWSKEQHVFCPKYADGSLQCPSDPAGLLSWTYYREGDALHYAWFVPHDPEGLLALYESPQAFDASLQSFLANHVPYFEKYGNAVPNPYYWAGNEHDFLAPWLFNVGPNCTNAQYWTRKLTYMHFSNTPHGIPGNDDYGSMSTWLIFGSLGIFPQAGTSRFFIGAPRVKNAQMQLRHWNRAPTTLSIETINNSVENTYIEKLLVNGQEWTKPYLDRSVLTSGDVKLEFYMHSTPASGLCPVR